MKKLATAFAIFVGLTLATQVQAHGYHHHRSYVHHIHNYTRHHYYSLPHYAGYGGNVAAARSRGLPWCGAYLADKLGFSGALGRELWVAENWAGIGSRTSPHIGAVVVWRHHVGQIVGRENGEWIINSGNDGHAVRSRPRSLAGAIAIRDIGGRSSFSIAEGYGEPKYARRQRRAYHQRYALNQPSYQFNDSYMNRWQVSQI